MKLHPMLVHFPIAFYFLELFLLVLWTARKDREYKRFAGIVFRLGCLFLVPAALAGLWDAGGISGIRGLVKPHATAALFVLIIYTIRILLYWKFQNNVLQNRWILLSGAALGTAAVFYAGFLGGVLVYD